MTSTEEEILKERVRQLEDAVLVLWADMQKMAIGVTDMQKVIVKMATNQQQMAERVSMWPYIKIDPNQKRKS